MIRHAATTLSLALACLISCAAYGDYTIMQGATPTTYSTTLNFDEPGGPTGNISPDAFASIGISELQAGDGLPMVGDNTLGGAQPWVGKGNSFAGGAGIFIKFENDLSEFSANIWDASGPPSPFGGGFGVFVFNDDSEVASYFGEPAWGGIGDPAVDITTSGGMVFDEVRILGFGNPLTTTYGDDFSWNVVPEPGSYLLLSLAGVLMLRLRRR
jgi:hypothetical protein